MKDTLRSPWASVTLAVFGLTAGYVLYLHMHGEIVHASNFCPAKEICNSGTCQTDGACNSEDCKRCPYCKNEARS